MEADSDIFRTHAGKGEQRTQISIKQKKKKCIWRNDELNMNNASKIKPKIKTKNQN